MLRVWLRSLVAMLKARATTAERLPREFARDHRIAQARYDPLEEIWAQRLRFDSHC